ncbi:RPW8 domain-containing protein [Heracleum sosnowskyi]|uniref:RPW8 domain-containing protein n=1 Tax=Heracleum sosnowskyi TaxID=360622 RepID=A0AAD8HVP1_9APIA|nr:RPW8 domain-containing protein [Heracleum sosnowskyi]
MDLIGGGVVGVAFSDLEKAFIKVIKTIARFKSTFKRLKATMDAIDLIFMDTRKLEQILERPQTELDFFAEELRRGTDLILLCSKIKSWNLYEKYGYSKKLQSFEKGLTRFFQISVQAHQVRSIRQVSKGVSDLSVKLDVVKKEILHGILEKIDSMSVSCSSSGSSRRYIGSAYVGEIPELVLGLDLPLKELKVMLQKDNDVLPTVVVLSAPPGCGKTTLANMVCVDSTIKEKFKKNIFFVTVSKAVNIQIAVKTIFKQKGCLDDLLKFQSDEDAINQLGQLLKQIGGGPDKDPILLVLDDVWSPGLEDFVQNFRFKEIPEYKILVTSRFASDLHVVYKLKLLNDQDAKVLFCHSVFPSGSEHPKISDKTVNQVVRACNGLPLALNVVGLSLRGKPEVTWKTTLNKCLDALDEEKGMETLKCKISKVIADLRWLQD